MGMIARTGYYAFLIAGFYGLLGMMEPETRANLYSFLFDDYIRIWDVHIFPMLPGWTHPVVVLIIIAGLIGLIPGFIPITGNIAAFIVALFIVRLGFMLFTSNDVTVSMTLAVYAMFAIGWLFICSVIGDRTLLNWLRDERTA